MDDDEEDLNAAVQKTAKHIASECRQLKKNKMIYQTRIGLTDAIANSSSTLLSLLMHLSPKFDPSMPCALIGNILTGMITNQATTLQIALGVLLRDKSVMDQFHDCGITCTYNEVLRFKASAASAASKKS